MTQHTPGPWVWAGSSETYRDGRYCVWTSKGPGYGLVAHCAPYGRPVLAEDSEVAEANARLIAAAPELLQALKRIIDDLPTRRDWLDPVLESAAKQAIAKAEGS